jgi:superoxide dismutase, Fe-Mn family
MSFREHMKLIEAAAQLEEIQLNKLPYALGALEPAMSRNSVDVHYNILTKNYFKKYEATGDLFQKAGAVLHNSYFWPLLQPYNKNNQPSKSLVEKINKTHKSLTAFKKAIVDAALTIQGNGWVLIMSDLQIQTIQNHILRPEIAMGIDLWEHTTVDYNFNREEFFSEFWNVVNWNELESRVL